MTPRKPDVLCVCCGRNAEILPSERVPEGFELGCRIHGADVDFIEEVDDSLPDLPAAKLTEDEPEGEPVPMSPRTPTQAMSQHGKGNDGTTGKNPINERSGCNEPASEAGDGDEPATGGRPIAEDVSSNEPTPTSAELFAKKFSKVLGQKLGQQ